MRASSAEVNLGVLGDFFLGSGKRIFLLSVVGASGITFAVMRAWLPSALDRLVKLVQTKRFWVPLCAAFLVGYLVLLGFNTTYVGYWSHIEPHIASASFVLLKGAPLYHDLGSAQRYSTAYGPMTYLPYTLALRVMGANVLSLRLVVMFANLCLLGLLWHCYRQLLDPLNALLVLVAVIASLGGIVFHVKGDILIISCVAIGLFAVLSTSTWISAFLLALACSFSFDIKVTALLYFFPLYVLFIRRHGWRTAAWSSVAGAVLAIVPFLLPGISVVRWLEWLSLDSQWPFLSRAEIQRELRVLIVCLMPGLMLWGMAQRSRSLLATYLHKNWHFLLALGSCLAAVAFFSSLIGAGPHHFLPFYPIFGYLCADIYGEMKGAGVARADARRLSFIPLLWFWLAAGLGTQIGPDYFSTASTVLTPRSKSVADAVAGDLEAVMKAHLGKTIEMGYGDWNSKYELTFFRPILIFAGNPFTIDAMALAGMQIAGDIPPSTLKYLGGCKTQIWLIPKDDPPFVMLNVFSLIDPHIFPERPLFSSEFRRIFFQHYRKQGSSKYFDIWECETGSGPPAGLKDQERTWPTGL